MTAISDELQGSAWKRFVLDYGFRARITDLAAVLDVPAEDIERLRKTGACTPVSKAFDFQELFSAWHGRSAEEADWPPPRKWTENEGYEWQVPEITLLASLVGQIGKDEIAQVLTTRLREVTGDPDAVRTSQAVQSRMALIGLQRIDVVGGITVAEAGRQIESVAVVRHAIDSGQLRSRMVGTIIVIPHDAWAEWKTKRIAPPEGFVQLSTLKEALAIKSDKLSEFARMGYVPTAVRVNPFGVPGTSTQYGTWYVSEGTAAQLLQDRRSGKPMPWHGKPLLDNLRVTYKLWLSRKHPVCCETCNQIWGISGAPADFEQYILRYPPLAHGAKRHLTMEWSPGLTFEEVAGQAKCSVESVRLAVSNGMLAYSLIDGVERVTRTDSTRWIARRCPSGESAGSWISIAAAAEYYAIPLVQMHDLIARGELQVRNGDGSEKVSRHQCGQFREKFGFTPADAARRAGVSVERFMELLEGTNWRGTVDIPLSTLQAVQKRLQSRPGFTLEEAALELNVSIDWVKARRDDGTIRITVAKWDRRRLYVTKPMLERLRAELASPTHKGRLSEEWLRLSDAAMEAGVSLATLQKWAEVNGMERLKWTNGWRYHRETVRAHARKFWATTKLRRAARPAWLIQEQSRQTTN